MPTLDAARDALARHFGFADFRLGQPEVISAILDGQPTLAVMPTGAGKSVCYQVPALVLDGLTIVVSPLISLMKDQVDALNARGIPATFINSSLTGDERAERMGRVRRGDVRLLYVAPERFRLDGFVNALAQVKIALFAVDEAHCMSQWGYDFRPDYQRLDQAIAAVRPERIAAFTATASREVRQDIVAGLSLTDPRIFVAGFARRNLVLRVVPIAKMAEKELVLREVLDRVGPAGIVYAATRKSVEEVFRKLCSLGVRCTYYHGGLDEAQRKAAQEAFMRGEADVVVATNAFGMGIDKADVRFVVHWELPGSLEADYQEAGRAGRDGKLSECVLLFTYADVRIQEFFIDRQDANPDPERPLDPVMLEKKRALDHARLKAMVRFGYAEDCRHRIILRYFGDRAEPGKCPVCDVCVPDQGVGGSPRPIALVAKTKRVSKKGGATATSHEPSEAEWLVLRKVLSAVARAGGTRSMAQLVALVRGEAHASDPLAGTPSDGILREVPEATVFETFAQLQAAACLMPSGGAKDAWLLTPHGKEVMWQRETPRLRKPLLPVPAGAPTPAAPRVDKVASVGGLFDALKAVRLQLARDSSVPPYVVAHDKSLLQMVEERPNTIDALAAIVGFGKSRAAKYGDAFLEALEQ